MKKYRLNISNATSALLVAISSIVLAACENFLDVKPRESISDAVTIVDRVSAESALNGVYSALGAGGYYGTTFQSIAYLSGDNIVWTGSQSQVQEFINHRVNPENSTIGGAWNAIYATINRANNVIDKVGTVTDASLTNEIRNRIIGEALAIRGLAYFDLARTYGGVPIILTPTISPSDNRGIPRATQQQTFERALADWNQSESLLPETTNRFRVTRKTVWALKARYFLYQKQYAEAEQFASRLIQDTNYELIAPFSAFFANQARGTRESVFEIFYNGTTEINNHRNQWQPQTNGGTRQWAPNNTLVGLLNTVGTGGGRVALIGRDVQNRWFGNLYYRLPGSDPSYIFRIAEAYLIRSEARAFLGNLTGALSDLNAVRSRAGLNPATATVQSEVLLAIENERRLEFAFEPHRWFDLVRTERAAAVLNITEPFRYLMPIPIDQLLADEALVQNPGY